MTIVSTVIVFALVITFMIIRARAVKPVDKKPFPTAARPLLLAHRGSMALWPENTLYGFERAASTGANVMEIDVRQTADGEIVVIHDETVDRVADGTGRVADLTLDELKSLDFAYRFIKDGDEKSELRGKGLTIPTLKELFLAMPGSYFNIDIKADSEKLTRDLLNLIRTQGQIEKVVIGSFYTNIVELIKKEAPEFATSASAREAWTMFLLNKVGLGRLHRPSGVAYQLPAAHLGMAVVTPSFVRTAHSLGQELHVWTIDEPAEMRRLLKMGVDGIVTNRSDLAVDVIKEFRK